MTIYNFSYQIRIAMISRLSFHLLRWVINLQYYLSTLAVANQLANYHLPAAAVLVIVLEVLGVYYAHQVLCLHRHPLSL